MGNISVQERYSEIARLSGFSEDIVRSILKACKKSLASSLVRGERATLPGICTMKPERHTRLKTNAAGEPEVEEFIKVKVTPSNTMDSEIAEICEIQARKSEEAASTPDVSELNFVDNIKPEGIRVRQIEALL